MVLRVGGVEARRERERREAWVVKAVKAGWRGVEGEDVAESRERSWLVQWRRRVV